jgi:hypothetical protein
MEAPVKLPTEPDSNPTVAREATDANTRAITSFGIGLAFVIVVSQLLLWWLFDELAGKEARLSPPVPAIIKAQAPVLPPEPRLQASPRLDLQKMLRDEDAVLDHYGWVGDPDRGIVRLPIQRALEIVAERGLPQFKAPVKTTDTK